jgi:hypothetical protein
MDSQEMKISIYWYYPADIKRYEDRERKKSIGPEQAQRLAWWRELIAKYPDMKSMQVVNKTLYAPGDWFVTVSNDVPEINPGKEKP